MNKHLLETRLKSIAHYNSEIVRQKGALSVTESTLNDVVKSCLEFFPFEHGDILLKDKRLYRVTIADEYTLNVIERNNSLSFKVFLFEPDQRDGRQDWRKKSCYADEIKLANIEQYKVIANTERL